jgi:hypothetical protein
MTKVALSGTDGNVLGPAFMNCDRLMSAVGNNCGNLVFQYAANRLVGEKVLIVGRDVGYSPVHLKKRARALVIPSANFLREGFDFSNFVDFLERSELPLVFLGLGAQAESFDQTKFDFHPSIDRLVSLLKERTKKISVRGEFTARVLDSLGVDNAVVTGCPSNFINTAEDFADRIEQKAAMPMRSFITHAEEPWPKSPVKAEADRRLVEWTRAGRGVMVQQSVPAMIAFLRKSNMLSGAYDGDHFEDALHKALMRDHDIEEFRDFLATKMRTYVSVDQWMEDSAKYDFSVGLRLHGNMAAWQAGTPALWIHHDARTRELAETMVLPSLAIEDFMETCHTIEDARDRWEFDKDGYVARRAQLRIALNSVLEAHDIKLAE